MALEAVGGFTIIARASGQEALNSVPAAMADLLLLDVIDAQYGRAQYPQGTARTARPCPYAGDFHDGQGADR